MRGRGVGALVAGVGAALYAATPLSDRDWPWHLADFERMMREGLWPWSRALFEDRFSYASEGDFLPVHWVFEVALGAANRVLGIAGVEVVRVLLVALAFALLARLLGKRGLGPLASAAVALNVAAATRARLLERPHLITLIAMILLWDQLLAFRDGKKKHLWTLVPLFLVWANSHPGVVYGVIFGLGFAVAARFSWKGWAGVLAGCVATLATPAGPRLYPYLVGHLWMQKAFHIAELRPLDLHHAEDVTFLVFLAIGFLFLLRAWRGGTRVDLVELLGTLGFVVLAVKAAREANLALVCLAILAAPSLADTIEEARGELEDKERGLHVFAWGFGLVLGFGFPAYTLGGEVWSGEVGSGLAYGAYPEREADWILAEKPHGPLWNTNASGGYLIWRLDPLSHPEWKVFTDGRQPLYAHAVNMTQAEIEERWAPNTLVFDYWTPPYDTTPWVKSRFVLVHFSDGGRTYLRRDGPDAALAAREGYRFNWFEKEADPEFPLESPRHWRLVLKHSSNLAEAARELTDRALMEEPGGYWANLALAQVLLEQGKKEDAQRAARRALLVRASAEARAVVEAAEKP
jgi:hypothetical protein